MHLDVLQDIADENSYKHLTCILGSLPHNIPVRDDSVSAVLVSEVFQFLTGEDITDSLKVIFKKLKKGGILALSSLSIYFFQNIDDAFVQRFFDKKEKGVLWPGFYESLEEKAGLLDNGTRVKQGVELYNPETRPTFINCCVLSQITDEMNKAGFEIIHAKEGIHPGYPLGDNQSSKSNIQVMGKKP